MSGLEAFAVACNVMQAIQFTASALTLCKDIYKGRSPAPEVQSRCFELRSIALELNNDLKNASQQGSQNDKELARIAASMLIITQRLEKELATFRNTGSSSITAALKNTGKYYFSLKSKIEKADTEVRSQQELMETRILVRLSKNRDVLQAAHSTNTDNVKAELKSFIQLVKNGNTKLEQLIDNNTGEIKGVIREEGERTRSHLDSSLAKHYTSQNEQDHVERVLMSLKLPEMNEREIASAINQSHSGTFKWIFEEELCYEWDSFTNWLRNGDGIYWISGKPGSGKSSLMRYLVTSKRTMDLLREWASDSDPVLLRAFLWKPGIPAQRSQRGLLATLLHQLFRAKPDTARAFCRNLSGRVSLSDWPLSDLENLLLEVLRFDSSPVCMFLDGLDEIDEDEFGGFQGLAKRITRFSEVPHVKLCLGSRPELVFTNAFAKYPKLRVQDLTREDMRMYVVETLEEVSSEYLTDEHRDKLRDEVVDRSDGVFLWVSLVTKSICRGLLSHENWDTLWARINQLPNTLTGLYKSMIGRMNEDDVVLNQEDSARYLQIAVEYKSPHHMTLLDMLLIAEPRIRQNIFAGGQKLTLEYLNNQCERMKQHVLSRAGGLLEVGRSPFNNVLADSIVSFIHRSAYDFLNDSEDGKRLLNNVKLTATEISIWSHPITIFRKTIIGAKPLASFAGPGMLSLTSWAIPRSERLTSADFLKSLFTRVPESREFLDAFPFVKFAASMGWTEIVMNYIEQLPINRPETQRVTSELLFWANNWTQSRFESYTVVQERVEIISALLEAKADCNLSPPDLDSAITFKMMFQTAFNTFLIMLHDTFHGIERRNDALSIPVYLETIYKFLDHGANVDGSVKVSLYRKGIIALSVSSLFPWLQANSPNVVLEVSVDHLLYLTHCRLLKAADYHEVELKIGVRELNRKSTTRPKVLAAMFVEPYIDNDIPRRPNAIFVVRSKATLPLFKDLDAKINIEVAWEFEEEYQENLERHRERHKPLSWDSVPQHYIENHALSLDETVDWFMDHGILPRMVDWKTKHTADDIIFRYEGPEGEIIYPPPELRDFDELDWSFKPEYDEFVKAVERISSSSSPKE